MMVLCQGCGMRVVIQADGSCPACGARGDGSPRVRRGQLVSTLVPTGKEPGRGAEYACLYLRPFASRVRAAGRMRAIAGKADPLA